MTITKERRGEIRAAAEKATPGPWEVGPVDDTVVTHLGADGLRYEVAGIDGDYNSPDEWPTMEANAAHIANCDPQTILALLDALDAAEKAEPVAVKPLVWSPGHSAKSPCGTFYIVPVNGKFGASLNAMTIIAEHLGLFETIDAAKTACEAHYEARIRSALVHPAPVEKAEPVAWMVRGHLRDGTAVLRLPVLTSREDADRYAACNPDYTLAPLYTHPAPAVREGWKPTHWALYSVSGSHIGLWTDETWVERLQAQYPGSTILPLSAAPEAK